MGLLTIPLTPSGPSSACSAKLSTSWFSSTCRTRTVPSRDLHHVRVGLLDGHRSQPRASVPEPGMVGATRGPPGSAPSPGMTREPPRSPRAWPSGAILVWARACTRKSGHASSSMARHAPLAVAGAVESDEVWVPESGGWKDRKVRWVVLTLPWAVPARPSTHPGEGAGSCGSRWRAVCSCSGSTQVPRGSSGRS